MAITVDEKNRIFTLHTKNSTYQMKADDLGALLHTYYGKRIDDYDMSYLIVKKDRGFSGNPYECGQTDKTYSPDVLPQEYSCYGTGDYRISALKVQNDDGSYAVSLAYQGYEVYRGTKYAIPGLPAVHVEDVETDSHESTVVDSLEITLKDEITGVEVVLLYGVLEESDIITRAVRIVNKGSRKIILQKAASMNMDWVCGDYEWLTFYGRHNHERNFQRSRLDHGIHAIGSVRGASSHHYNPFTVVCEENADETTGCCYGFSFLYSGEFLMEAEKDQANQTRLICGIHPDNFAWNLELGEEFHTPEIMMTTSEAGFGMLSRNFHRTIREHVCRGVWKHKRRPVLINNWEATYFNFTGEQLVNIAKGAADLGVELFVLDDGWYGRRNGEDSGLGDWFPNEEKLGCTLKALAEKIVAMGMQFGIWVEPEGLSEESDLYHEHPEWAVAIPGRRPSLARKQLILDFSRRDVQDYMIKRLSAIFTETPITYVKWDFNRNICDKYSQALTPDKQGEFAHRYVVGLYRVLEELTADFPYILFEGCSGGGGRFDAGMLYYTPQIWCSDDTDAIERLSIQYGTSFCYPVSTMGAHVSAVPNHQTGRVTPLSTRACVAMAGTFGYELDISKMTEAEKDQVRSQIRKFKKYYDLIQYGDYYRLLPPSDAQCTVWETVSPDGKEALVSAVYHHTTANAAPVFVKVQGLQEECKYQVRVESDHLPDKWREAILESLPSCFREGETVTGAALRHGGLVIPGAFEGYGSWQIYISSR